MLEYLLGLLCNGRGDLQGQHQERGEAVLYATTAPPPSVTVVFETEGKGGMREGEGDALTAKSSSAHMERGGRHGQGDLQEVEGTKECPVCLKQVSVWRGWALCY